MKYMLVLTFLLFGALTSCKDDVVHPAFRQSLNSWQYYKKTNNDTYRYTQVISTSVFNTNGGGAEIRVRVSNGIITQRDFTRFEIKAGTKERVIIEEWRETGAQVNTNADVPKSLTFDEIYDKAEHEWLNKDEKENTIIFETNVDGLILNCGYVPKGCQDDCFTGINIKVVNAG